MPRPAKVITFVLAAFLYGEAVYRAVTLSVTIDEAYTYTQFVSRPLPAAAIDYDANNHVLYTLLAKATTSAFAPSDLTLRLPALAGAALFYASLYRLLAGLAGPGWWLPLAFAFIGGNTFLADLLPLARGYGLALAFFTLALSLLLDPPSSRDRRLVGIALGLSVAANLTFLFPAAGLLVGLIWLERRQGLIATAWAAGTSGALLAIPLWHAKREHFYFGADSLLTSLGTLMGGSLTRNLGERGGPVEPAMAIMVVTLAAAVVVGSALRERSRALFLLASSIAGGVLLLVSGHYTVGLVYPHGRTGIAWLLLAGLSLTALGARFPPALWLAAPLAITALFYYQQAWSTATTIEWAWDAGTRAICERIAGQPRASGQTIRIAASPLMSHTINYYRRTRGWEWMEDVKADADIKHGHFDYYVLLDADRLWAQTQGMTVLYEHRAAGSILAKKAAGE